jgi:hypothetical protein
MRDEPTSPRVAAAAFDWCPADAMHVLPGAMPCAAALVSDALAARDGVAIVLGSDADATLVRELGATTSVRVVGAVSPALREPVLAARALRRTLGDRLAPSDVVAWGLDAAVTARVAWPASVVTAVLLDGGASPCSEWLARRGARWRPQSSRAIGADVAAHFAEVVAAPIELLPPLEIRSDRLQGERRAIRRRWGARNDECVVGLLGEPADRVDARRVAQLVGIAAVRGERVRLVLHPGAARLDATERWLAGIDIPRFCIVDDAIARPWEILAGLDVACIDRDAAETAGRAGYGARLAGFGGLFRARPGPISPLPAFWARAAGVPIVAEAGAMVGALAGGLPESVVTTWTDDDAVAATRRIVEIARTLGGDRPDRAPTVCATPA